MAKENGYWKIDIDHETQIVRITRLPQPYPTLEDVRTSFEDLLSKLTHLHRAEYGALFDLRHGPPPRSDAEFEQKMSFYTPKVTEGWAGAVTLVQTLPGMIQLKRMANKDNNLYQPFDDELAAESYLLDKIDEALDDL